MYNRTLTVKHVYHKTCFLYMSPKNARKFQEKNLRVSYNDDKLTYFSTQSDPLIDDRSVGINFGYAKRLGIKENDEVAVTEVEKLPTIEQFTASPLTSEDFTILNLTAEHTQSDFMRQVRVLNEGQVIVLWVGKIRIPLVVYDLIPVKAGRNELGTALLIKPPDSNCVAKLNVGQSGSSSNFNYFASKRYKEIANLNFLEEYRYRDSFVLRVIPSSKLKLNHGISKVPFNVFVLKKSLPASFLLESHINFLVCSMTVLNPDSENKVFYVRLCFFEHFLADFSLETVSSDNIFVPDAIFDHIGCEMGVRVELEPFFDTIPVVNEVEICTKTAFLDVIEENFKAFLAECCEIEPFLLNSEVVLNIGKGLSCFARFQPARTKFCLVSSDFLRECKFSVHDVVLPVTEIKPHSNLNNLLTDIGNFSYIIKDSLAGLVFQTLRHKSLHNVLIHGSSGTGKTALLCFLEQLLTDSPYYIFTKRVDCKLLKGKTFDSLHKFFINIFIELVHHQPSVLLVDDLQVMCGAVLEDDTAPQNSVFFANASEMFVMLMEDYCTNNLISVFATTESALKLNKQIYSTRNIHLFKNVYCIQNLSKDDRIKFLIFFLLKFKLENEDLEYLATKTESFVAQDLIDLKNRIIYESHVTDSKNPKITKEICETALKNTTMLALQDVKLYSKGTKDFSDIGGLTDVKQTITELILWPTKYPKIFDDPPIRLPTGMLFYGAPGTGKTLLAGAAAKYCDIRLISVKGPELLSKYIGASEQGVRDIFEKAQNAKPCILFFDEFDSLAPRRGNDNTGVTDRVVNQFLTQLDGVEVLTGVWVIAATSRPDLLDPALLRPGRLDRKIFFPLPSKGERREILRILLKTVAFSDDVDLKEIAEKSEGFTGADLQALVNMGLMDSLDWNEDITDETEEYSKSSKTPIKLTQNLLLNALKNSRPSLSGAEKQKFDQIYRRFQGGQSEDVKADSKLMYA